MHASELFLEQAPEQVSMKTNLCHSAAQLFNQLDFEEQLNHFVAAGEQTVID